MAPSEQTQILVAIAQLDTKVEMAILELGKDVKELNEDINKHDARIHDIEKRIYAIPGLATVIAAGSLLWSIFGN